MKLNLKIVWNLKIFLNILFNYLFKFNLKNKTFLNINVINIKIKNINYCIIYVYKKVEKFIEIFIHFKK